MKFVLRNCCGLVVMAQLLLAKDGPKPSGAELSEGWSSTLVMVAIGAFVVAYVSLKAVEDYLDDEMPFETPKPAADVFIDQLLAGNGANLRVSR